MVMVMRREGLGLGFKVRNNVRVNVRNKFTLITRVCG